MSGPSKKTVLRNRQDRCASCGTYSLVRIPCLQCGKEHLFCIGCYKKIEGLGIIEFPMKLSACPTQEMLVAARLMAP